MIRLNDLKYRLRGELSTEQLIAQGMKVGKKFERMNNVLIDDSHAWLIEIGDNVTLAPRVHILAHDASTKKFLGYTKIGRVTIGNNVVIGANSTVTHDLPDNTVAVGCPARVLCSLDEYLDKEKKRMERNPVYGRDYTLRGNISMEKRMQQKGELSGEIGFVE